MVISCRKIFTRRRWRCCSSTREKDTWECRSKFAKQLFHELLNR